MNFYFELSRDGSRLYCYGIRRFSVRNWAVFLDEISRPCGNSVIFIIILLSIVSDTFIAIYC
jgi:hypothetical protein